MSNSVAAIFLSAALSIILAFIQITVDAKTSKVHGVWTVPFILYTFIMIFGNTITTLVSASIVDSYLVDVDNASGNKTFALSGPVWIWYSTLGVFGFEAIIQKINITFFDQGVLSINDWLTKAKNAATAATLERIVDLEILEVQKIALSLTENRDSAGIHTFASIKLGNLEYQDLIASISEQPNINLDKYLAHLLAERFPKEVKAEIKAK